MTFDHPTQWSRPRTGPTTHEPQNKYRTCFRIRRPMEALGGLRWVPEWSGGVQGKHGQTDSSTLRRDENNSTRSNENRISVASHFSIQHVWNGDWHSTSSERGLLKNKRGQAHKLPTPSTLTFQQYTISTSGRLSLLYQYTFSAKGKQMTPSTSSSLGYILY